MWAKALRLNLTIPLSQRVCHEIQVTYCLKIYSRYYYKRKLTLRHHVHMERKLQMPKIIPHLFGVLTCLGGSQHGETW